jgi:thiamine pyrophosphate-dependent acetolactate synthase large subunit-like protein
VVSEAIRRLNEAERPAILVGRGVQKSGHQLLELAAKWQAGICLSMPAKGMLSGSEFIMGGLGEGGSEAATALLAAADLILIVGATWWPEKYVPPLKRIIQLDPVPENIGGRTQVEYGVVGDVAVLLPTIINGLSYKEKSDWREQLRKISRQWRELMNLDPTVTAITNSDFSKIAQACGGSEFRVERPEDLAEALSRAIQSQQPAIVDVITSPAPFPGIVKQQQTYREPAPV